mmetsp:Transcript_17598/g.26494  ORF Transcript_17598/g.26494 Transcript_17598/m.26494 type:complete len:169 (+) Transcript_17598:58-564(+)
MKASIYLSVGLFFLMIYASSTSPPRSPLAVTSSKIMSSTDEADTKNNDAERDHQEYNITRYITMKFEVFGRVQGVFFRKYTKAKAEELGLTGWCRNTPRGTVQGEFEYALSSNGNNIDEESWEAIAFQHWLCRTGSPKSRIDECTFSEKLKSSSSARTRKYDAFRIIR